MVDEPVEEPATPEAPAEEPSQPAAAELPPQPSPSPPPPPPPPAREVEPDTAANRIGRTLCVLCLLSLLMGIVVLVRGGGAVEALTSNDFDESFGASLLTGADGVAVVKLYGMIAFEEDSSPFGKGADRIVRTLRRLRKADRVKGVVLRINSPGGTVAASQEIHDEIKALVDEGKKVVVSMGDVAASGGYYVAAPANYIFANPGTLTGSVGVITTLMDYRQILEKLGLQYTVIKSGRFKDMGAGYREMTDEEKALFEKVILGAWDQFVSAVADGRIIKDEGDERDGRKRVITSRDKMRDELCQGQIFLGSDAREVGLVDELGTYYDAVAKCGELCNLGKNPHLIHTSRMSGFEQVLEMFGMSPVSRSDPMRMLMRVGTMPPLLYMYVPGK